ncbi:hypothetical protein [Colwellia sp. MB02u-14]|uniref:hypothetical protein n=1 Tax=Colwellia sp. MB02u-14 TaxID=2759815 RepID=UPI0015F57FAC|nr:hypothetical protein [Colwellia sp. MB02u-14]MBA6303467.1 hypothetical protein [Colwellia sp. MB02u-14]
MAGRKKLSELDKAKSKASRLYWKHQDTLTTEFSEEHVAKELQFSTSEKQMGRPPLKLSLIQNRALKDYSESLADYREIEQNEGVEAVSDNEIIDYKKSDRAGRKAKDEILHIKKYIRRTQRQINDIKAQDNSDFALEHEGPGRPGKSKLDKIALYQQRIDDAELEIEKLMIDKAAHEIVYYELFELKNDRRTLVVEQKKHNEDSNEFIGFAKDIGLLDERIKPIQAEYDKALELAGLKHVRSAPSARARPATEVEAGGWSASEQSSVKVNESSEVDKLKAEMQEMKKMMMEQAELIKALTNKD